MNITLLEALAISILAPWGILAFKAALDGIKHDESVPVVLMFLGITSLVLFVIIRAAL